MIINNSFCEAKGASLRNFNEDILMDSINGALALREHIEQIIDMIYDDDFDGIWFMGIGGTWASAMQAEVHVRGRSRLPIYCENAAEFLTTGNRKFTENSVAIISSVSGSTREILDLCDRIHEIGGKVFSFVDTPDSPLTKRDKSDYLIVYPKNEQLKFFMAADYLMYRNGEFDDYERFYENLENSLAEALAETEELADPWAYRYAEKQAAFHEARPDMPHYFVGCGNQWGAVYSLGMCYWEEQFWIRCRTVQAGEFFHGMLEIIDKQTPVTLFMGEDEQRPLAERVADFLPRICENYAVIDTREFPLTGIRPEYRGRISHLVMRAVNNRIEAYMEMFLRHPMEIRRYYGRMKY